MRDDGFQAAIIRAGPNLGKAGKRCRNGMKESLRIQSPDAPGGAVDGPSHSKAWASMLHASERWEEWIDPTPEIAHDAG